MLKDEISHCVRNDRGGPWVLLIYNQIYEIASRDWLHGARGPLHVCEWDSALRFEDFTRRRKVALCPASRLQNT